MTNAAEEIRARVIGLNFDALCLYIISMIFNQMTLFSIVIGIFRQ